MGKLVTASDITLFLSADSLLNLNVYNSLPLSDRPTRSIVGLLDINGFPLAPGTPIDAMGGEDSAFLGPSPGADYYRIGAITDKFGIPNQKVVRTLHISQFVAKV